MLGLRRPHTSSGARSREKERERESERIRNISIDDHARYMRWTTSDEMRSKAGLSKGGDASMLGDVAGASRLPLTQSIYSAEPHRTAAARATLDGRGQRRERRGIGLDGVGNKNDDGMWEEFGGRTDKGHKDMPAGSRNPREQTAATTTTRKLDEQRFRLEPNIQSSSSSAHPTPSSSGRQSRPSTSPAPKHAPQTTHNIHSLPPLPLAAIKEHWYNAYSAPNSGTAAPKSPRNPERTRSSSRPSTASGILEGRFFRDMISSSNATSVGSRSSRSPQPTLVCLHSVISIPCKIHHAC